MSYPMVIVSFVLVFFGMSKPFVRHRRLTRLRSEGELISNMMTRPVLIAASLLLPLVSIHSQTAPLPPMTPIPSSVTYAPSNPLLPTIFIVGDSTGVGWGPYFVPFFDPNKVNVVVAAAAGRSSRTYMTEGLWDRVKLQLHPHDIVLIQFGHNDPFAINDMERARGSIKGIGDDTQEIDNLLTHKHEAVHTFGWYLRQYVQEAKSKGAMPVIMSLTPDNIWNGDAMEPDHFGYAGWSAEVAAQEHVDYVNINGIMSDRLTKLGPQKTTELFATNDKTHLTKAGWQLTALWTFEALEYLKDKPVDHFLSERGRKVYPARP